MSNCSRNKSKYNQIEGNSTYFRNTNLKYNKRLNQHEDKFIHYFLLSVLLSILDVLCFCWFNGICYTLSYLQWQIVIQYRPYLKECPICISIVIKQFWNLRKLENFVRDFVELTRLNIKPVWKNIVTKTFKKLMPFLNISVRTASQVIVVQSQMSLWETETLLRIQRLFKVN